MSTKHQTKRAPSSLPTLDEVPLTPNGISFVEDFTRLLMIPPDDVALRSMAINLYKYDELDNVTVGGAPGKRSDLPSLDDCPARTPGGVAWKIYEALSWIRANHEDDKWPQPHLWLQSAIGDALDLERQRAASSTSPDADVTVALVERIWDNIEEEMAADEVAGGKLFVERMALQRLLGKTPATSFEGVIAKMRALCNMLVDGKATDNRDELLLKSAIADLQRLTGNADAEEVRAAPVMQEATPAIAAE